MTGFVVQGHICFQIFPDRLKLVCCDRLAKHRRKRCFNLQIFECVKAFACWWIPQTCVPTMWGWLMSKQQASWSVCVLVSHTQHIIPSCSLLALSSNWLRFQSATMNINLACLVTMAPQCSQTLSMACFWGQQSCRLPPSDFYLLAFKALATSLEFVALSQGL